MADLDVSAIDSRLNVEAPRQRIICAGGAVPHRAVTSSSLPSPARVSVRERRPHSCEPVADSADVFGEQDSAEFLEAGRRIVKRPDDRFRSAMSRASTFTSRP